MGLTGTDPLVSVIVPSFNQGHFIRETINSILSQDYRPLEILVIDGGSTDNTVEVLQSYGDRPELKWWSEPDEGVTDAVNKGLNRAAGDILAIQSSDDVYLPGAIRAAVDAMDSHDDVALVYGDVEYIDENSRALSQETLTPFDLKRYLGRFSYIPQPSTFFRASVVKEIGGWRQEVSYAADADYWLRIAIRHKVRKLGRVMGGYRYHSEQRDTQRTKIARDWEQTVRNLLASTQLDQETRRFALMGIHLARYHYTPESDWVRRSQHLYRAAAANPSAVVDRYFPKRELLVGREPIWKFLSRTKRRFGFSPRTGESPTIQIRQKLGALLYDLPTYAKQMWLPSKTISWVSICNRDEDLSFDTEKLGAKCEWEWTSDLHIAKVFPTFGRLLMKRALGDWPIVLQSSSGSQNGPVSVSFVIGHRGRDRVPHLLTTLKSIAAQSDVAFECIVVEQSNEPEVKAVLPNWVRYLHTPLPRTDMPYSRSWAFNVGANLARGSLLVFHDNDMLLPKDYAAHIVALHHEGHEVMNIKRFVFYLNQEQSERIMKSGDVVGDGPPETVVQNLEAGGSFAITREAYFSIGGFDEGFVGWGGEDNEFWQRAQTRTVWSFGFMPILHLWHPAQPEKLDRGRGTAKLLEERSSIPAQKRIEELRVQNFQSSLYRVNRHAVNG